MKKLFKWKTTNKKMFSTTWYKCPCCNEEVSYEMAKMFNYCPYCRLPMARIMKEGGEK